MVAQLQATSASAALGLSNPVPAVLPGLRPSSTDQHANTGTWPREQSYESALPGGGGRNLQLDWPARARIPLWEAPESGILGAWAGRDSSGSRADDCRSSGLPPYRCGSWNFAPARTCPSGRGRSRPAALASKVCQFRGLRLTRKAETPCQSCLRQGVSPCSPDGIRTRATALRGRRARPLHNGAPSCRSCDVQRTLPNHLHFQRRRLIAALGY